LLARFSPLRQFLLESSERSQVGQLAASSLDRQQRHVELATVRLVAGVQPFLSGAVEQLEFAAANSARRQLLRRSSRPRRVACFEQLADLGQTLSREHLPQFDRRAVVGESDLLAAEQIVPRGFGIVLPEMAFPALDEAESDLLEEVPGPGVAGG